MSFRYPRLTVKGAGCGAKATQRDVPACCLTGNNPPPPTTALRQFHGVRLFLFNPQGFGERNASSLAMTWLSLRFFVIGDGATLA